MRRGRSYSEKVLLEGENFDHTIKLSKNISSSNNAELASFGSCVIAVWNELDIQKEM